MKTTNGLSIKVEETKTIFNKELFRLYDFYKFSDDNGNSEIRQLVKCEDEYLTFLITGQTQDNTLTRYSIIATYNIKNDFYFFLVSFVAVSTFGS